MDREILKKMERYVELSAKFSKEENDIFPKTGESGPCSVIYGSSGSNLDLSSGLSSGDVIISGNLILNDREIYTNGYGHVKSREVSEPTRADEIRARARVLAILSDEFDEYNKLRSDLNDYFKAVNKLVD